jgi:hypothetical protein
MAKDTTDLIPDEQVAPADPELAPVEASDEQADIVKEEKARHKLFVDDETGMVPAPSHSSVLDKGRGSAPPWGSTATRSSR